MSRSHLRIAGLIVCSAMTLSTEAALADQYAAGCSEDYSGCGGGDLPNSCNNITNAEGELSQLVYSRTWYFRAEVDNWPQDWWEQALGTGGVDHNTMDKSVRRLAIWSGHGTGASTEPNQRWEIAHGTPHNGQCHASAPSQIKFGENGTAGWSNDSKNHFLIMDASCSAVLGERQQVWYNSGPGILMGTYQGFGFHASPDDASDRIEEFAENVIDGMSNKDAWMDAGETCYVFDCINSPVIFTHGRSEADANYLHNNVQINNVFTGGQKSGWGGYYRYTRNDNGDSC